jgi:hypothetical protein
VEKDYLVLKRATGSRPSGEWSDEDYDVLADGVVVGRIFLANAAPVGASWMWTLLLEHHKDRTSTHGYAATREAGDGSVRKKLAAGIAPALRLARLTGVIGTGIGTGRASTEQD